MAMVQCPECGREVSDQAAACPNCGCPLGVTSVAPAKREKAASLRGGAIIGLVGGLSFIAVLVIATLYPSEPADYTISVGPAYTTLYAAAFVAIIAAAPVFAVALAFGERLKRKAAMTLSVCAVVLSATGLLGMLMCFNVALVCVGWFFLWEPVLELVGSIKMLKNALRYEE